MIGFKIAGEFLDLTPGFTVPIEWQSGLFSDEFVLNGISTLPITFPFTGKNKRLLQYFNIIENNLKNLQVNCELWLAGNLWCTGELTVGVKGETFDTDFSEITPLALAADKKLSEILKDDVTYVIAPFQQWWTINVNYAFVTTSVQFVFTINNHDNLFTTPMTGSHAADADSLFAQCTGNVEMIALFDMVRISDLGTGEEIIKFTKKIEDVIDTAININVDAVYGCQFNTASIGVQPAWCEYQRDAIVSKLFADVDKLYADANFCFPMIKNPDFYGTNNPVYTSNHKVLNYFRATYLKNTPTDTDRYSLSPQLYIGYLIKRLGVVLNFTQAGTFTQINDLYNRLFLYNNRAIDLIGSDFKDPWLDQPVYNFWQGKFFTGDHTTDATLKELLTSLSKYFSLGLFYRNGVLNFETKKSLLESTVIIDWTNKSFRIYDELRGTFTQGFTLKYTKDGNDAYLEHIKELEGPFIGQFDNFSLIPTIDVKTGSFAATKNNKRVYRSKIQRIGTYLTLVWELFCEYLHDYNYIKTDSDIPTNASQTLKDFFTETGFRQCLLPRIDEQGASYEYDMPNKLAPLRYLLYWGLQSSFASSGGGEGETFSFNTSDAYKFPMAQMDNLGMDGSVLGPYKIRFEDSDGVFENWHKQWLDFLLQTKKLTIRILLAPSELLQVDLSKKVKIGVNQFFIEKITASIGTSDTLIECLIDMYKI